MPEIALYQFPPMEGVDSGSPFCAKVHRALTYKKLTYEVRTVMTPGELKRINPHRVKVPALQYDGEIIVDSTQILVFLDQKHPSPTLYPADPSALARVRLLEDWADESLYWFTVYLRWAVDHSFQALAQCLFSTLPPPIRWLVPSFVRRGVLKSLRGQGIGRLSQAEVEEAHEAHLDMLEVLLGEGPFFVGEALSAADLALFGPLQGLLSPVTPEAGERIRCRARLMQWLRAVDAQTSGEYTAEIPS